MDEDNDEGDREKAREEVIDAMARSAEMYGAKRSYGRLFGILYFANEPLSLDTLVEESGYAKSTVSTAMSTLERFQLVQRRSLPGEGKRAFFEVEEDFWYIFQQFLDQKVRREIDMMSRALETAETTLSEADGEQATTDLERVQELQRMYSRSETLINIMTSERLEQLVSLIERVHDEE